MLIKTVLPKSDWLRFKQTNVIIYIVLDLFQTCSVCVPYFSVYNAPLV